MSVNQARSVHQLHCLVEEGGAEEAVGCPVVIAEAVRSDVLFGVTVTELADAMPCNVQSSRYT